MDREAGEPKQNPVREFESDRETKSRSKQRKSQIRIQILGIVEFVVDRGVIFLPGVVERTDLVGVQRYEFTFLVPVVGAIGSHVGRAAGD